MGGGEYLLYGVVRHSWQSGIEQHGLIAVVLPNFPTKAALPHRHQPQYDVDVTQWPKATTSHIQQGHQLHEATPRGCLLFL